MQYSYTDVGKFIVCSSKGALFAVNLISELKFCVKSKVGSSTRKVSDSSMKYRLISSFSAESVVISAILKQLRSLMK